MFGLLLCNEIKTKCYQTSYHLDYYGTKTLASFTKMLASIKLMIMW